jgi:hypothetical protein
MIEYPKPNPGSFSEKMLTSGHSHFILLGKEKETKQKNNLLWGDEAKFKINFAERLANGRKGFPYKSKVCGIILGNIPNCIDEILMFVDRNWPLILVEDSELTSVIKDLRNGEDLVDINASNFI